jgi:pilus assembly protein CpaF
LPMLNAMSQGRSGSMCTIHADSSAGIFKRLASYAVQSPERLPLESTNILIAGAVHFVVFIDVDDSAAWHSDAMEHLSEISEMSGSSSADQLDAQHPRFQAVRRERFISSVREVVDADGLQVVSNEVFAPGLERRAVTGAPLRSATLDELIDNGYEPTAHTREVRTW